MQAAMAASRAGEDALSVRLLGDLLRRYPQSPLAQNAAVERFRALRRLGDVRSASSEARRYLSEHPKGMASDEARRVASEPQAAAPVDAYPR